MLVWLFRKAGPSAPGAIGTLGDWQVIDDAITAPADVVSQVNDLTIHADHAVQATSGDRPSVDRATAPGVLLIAGNGTDHLDAPQDQAVRTIGFLVWVPATLASERQVFGRDGTTGNKPAIEIAIA